MNKIIHIAAIGQDRQLGLKNKLLWQLPGDLKHFKKTTLNHPIIMGSKTFESIGKPLPKRINIVLSRTPVNHPGVIWAQTPERAIEIAHKKADGKDIFIIGGGIIYKLFLPLSDELYLTLVKDSPEADTFFPEFEDKFEKYFESQLQKENGIKYSFSKWKRKNP